MATPTVKDTFFEKDYPQFLNKVNEDNLFFRASLIFDPSDNSIVKDFTIRGRLLGLLMAHIAELTVQSRNGNNLAGPITSASEGSVSVESQFTSRAGAEWYETTVYGREFWQATIALRGPRYVRRRFNGRPIIIP